MSHSTDARAADDDVHRDQSDAPRGPRRLAFETLAVHVGGEPDETTGAVVPPIYAVSTYAQDSVASPRAGFVYGRGANPTRSRLEKRLAALEGGVSACAFSSGMAAEDAVFSALCKPGDHVIIPADVYGGTYRLLDKVFQRWGLSYMPVDMSDLTHLRDHITSQPVRIIWCETPTNPLLSLANIGAISKLAHEAGALLVVDNTFATPYLQRPLALGADVVVHSTTKYIGGHSDVIGGAVVTSDDEIGSLVRFHQNATGAIPSPFDAWLILRGIQTLAVRVRQQSATALRLAIELRGHRFVERVYYPGLTTHPGHELAVKQMQGFGGMVSFTLQAGENAAVQVCDSTRLFTLAESLGAVESLICHPLRMTHASAAGSSVAPPGNLVRLSVGLESADDLAYDLMTALDKVNSAPHT